MTARLILLLAFIHATSAAAFPFAFWKASRIFPDANTILLLHFDSATAVDATVNNWTPVNNNSATSGDTVHIKFGVGTFHSTGTKNWQYSPTAFGTGDFTVDWWTYNTAWGNNNGASIGTQDAGIHGWDAQATTSGIRWNGPSGVIFTTSGLPTNNAWHHIAFVRSGSTVTAYFDGTSVGSGTDTNNYTDTQFRVGYSTSTTAQTNGDIDEVRLSNVARWTSNFTPPTLPY